MKRSHLVALAIALAVLLGVRWLVSRHGTGLASDLHEAGVGEVLPAPVDPSAITWIRVSGPPSTDGAGTTSPLLIERVASGWTVASAYGAPADAKLVDDFLSRLAHLGGELRGEGEAGFAEFGVDEAKATKVEVGIEPGQPAAVLWVGREGDVSTSHFMRAEGSTAIRHVRDGLRSALELRGEDATPAVDLWVDKLVHEAEPDELSSVAFERSDVTYRLQREPSAAADGKGAWRIASPELPFEPQADALDGVVSRAARVRVASILDPAAPACGFTPATAAATATFERVAGPTSVLRVGGKLEGRDEVPLRVEGREQCYGLGTWSLTSLVPRASALWNLPLAFDGVPPSAEPTRVRIQRDGALLEAVRDDAGAWTLESPTRAPADAARAERIASTLLSLRLDDLAEESRVPAGALDVDAVVSVTVGGRPLVVRILGTRPGGVGERYIRVQDGATLPEGWVGVIARTTAEALLPTSSELAGPAAR